MFNIYSEYLQKNVFRIKLFEYEVKLYSNNN